MTDKKKKESGNSGQESGAASPADSIPPTLRPALKAIFKWAESEDFRAALIGGVAVCLHGSTRPTEDVDVLVLTTETPESVYDSLVESGFEPRFPDTVAFANATRAMLMRHGKNGAPVDVVLGMLPFDFESMDRSNVEMVSGFEVRVFPAESLCVMKLIAGRERDLRDVALLIETYPKLDREWIVQNMEQFALAMESPEALTRAKEMLGVDA